MPSTIPIKELRTTTKNSRICHESNEPVFVTRNGCGDMVLMSMEMYKRNMPRIKLFCRIAEGETNVREGNLSDSNSIFKSLRKELTC